MKPKQDNRITFSHGTARFTVQPANAQRVRDQLSALDNSKPRKFRAPRGSDTGYPQFTPGMSTAEYIKRFQKLNGTTGGTPEEIKRSRLAFKHADRVAPMLDPLTPEVAEEVDPDYVAPTKPARRPGAGASLVAALRGQVAALEAEVAALRQQLTADLL